MSVISENQLCYFCDETYPYSSCFIGNYNGVWVCFNCDEFNCPINYNIHENRECPVCYENSSLFELIPCKHKICLKCCKTIYFGSTTNERPIHLREMNIECPDWPYDFNDDDDNDPQRIKYDEYSDFENKYFDFETNNYDELINIRNNLISERSETMNTEEFINYENCSFRYHTEYMKSEKEWEQYNENKTKGNCTCPLCRKKPF